MVDRDPGARRCAPGARRCAPGLPLGEGPQREERGHGGPPRRHIVGQVGGLVSQRVPSPHRPACVAGRGGAARRGPRGRPDLRRGAGAAAVRPAERVGPAERAERGRHRAARRPGGAAAVRRHGGRPVPGPGLRAGPGPVLRDGLPAARHRRPAVRAGRHQLGRADGGRGRADAGLAAGRRAGAAPAVAGHPALPAGLRGRRERLPQGPLEQPGEPGVRRAGPEGARLPDRAVDAGRLAGLAQGDGLGPQGELHRGGGPGGARREHPGAADQRALPAVRRPAQRADPLRRRPGGDVEQHRDERGGPDPARGVRHAGEEGTARRHLRARRRAGPARAR